MGLLLTIRELSRSAAGFQNAFAEYSLKISVGWLCFLVGQLPGDGAKMGCNQTNRCLDKYPCVRFFSSFKNNDINAIPGQWALPWTCG
eukprot:Gb_02763 [translate_table: standard]